MVFFYHILPWLKHFLCLNHHLFSQKGAPETRLRRCRNSAWRKWLSSRRQTSSLCAQPTSTPGICCLLGLHDFSPKYQYPEGCDHEGVEQLVVILHQSQLCFFLSLY
uniref:Uncharacterized protein n=1 Tax=Lepeophtheirus salmonis TaxID=72036 RepID=A0A0K2TKR2_LEPSM